MGQLLPGGRPVRDHESAAGPEVVFMVSGSSDDTGVTVIDALTVVIRKQPDGGALVAEVIDLPGCTARAGTREELIEATGRAIAAFLGR